jgi:hypothetical protein
MSSLEKSGINDHIQVSAEESEWSAKKVYIWFGIFT